MGKLESSGFTLVEVLVSMLVLAVGMIGTARVQLTALRTAQHSAYQTTALQLAAEIADRMRANNGQAGSGGVSGAFSSIDYSSTVDPLGTPPTMCYASNCGADDLANFDIYEWKSRVKNALPGGRIKICRDAKPWDSAANALTWACTAHVTHAGAASLVIKIGWQGKGASPDGRAIKDATTVPPSVALTVRPYAE
jgi:type IV pilus assembly protein PilV